LAEKKLETLVVEFSANFMSHPYSFLNIPAGYFTEFQAFSEAGDRSQRCPGDEFL
jgi:hypothetical protein